MYASRPGTTKIHQPGKRCQTIPALRRVSQASGIDTLGPMAALPSNPFAVLSFIVAPAVLTNASSVLILSTSNRLARAVDRTRALSRELEASQAPDSEADAQRLRELTVAEK